MSPLDEAKKLVHGDRGEAYGHPADDYQATVDMWRAMIRRRYGVDIPLTADFGCLMMVAVKLSREAGKPKPDNLVDAAGYVECASMCLERNKANAETSNRVDQKPVSQKPYTTLDLAGNPYFVIPDEPGPSTR